MRAEDGRMNNPEGGVLSLPKQMAGF